MAESFDEVWETLPAGALQSRIEGRGLDATVRPIELAETAIGQRDAPESADEPTEPEAAAAAPLPVLELGASDEAHGAGSAELQLLGPLGEGGMGRVIRARQRSLQREVAVKTLHPGAQDTAVVAALLAEARITGRLEHPGIVPVHALGRDEDSRPVLVMKQVEGVSWRALITDPAHPAWAQLETLPKDRLAAHLQILMEVCNAVAFAHSHGVLHRDIKPENVMAGYFGEVYLVDWGVACHKPAPPAEAGDGTGGPLAGSPAYMAPEMAAPGVAPLCEQTDVYLLGATLHEALTGHPPHAGDNAYQVLLAAYQSHPPTYGPDVPEELASICRRAMAPDPADRFASALEFRSALSEFLEHRASIELSTMLRPEVEQLERQLTGKTAATHAGEGTGEAADPRADETAGEGTDALAVERRFSECRFGLMHALRQWSENTEARRMLQRSLELMIGHRLERGEIDAAAALLPDLPEANPDIEEHLQQARAARERERQENARLRAMAHDLDVTVSRRERVMFFGALALFVSGETGALVWLRMGDVWEPTHGGSIGLVVACLTFLLLAVHVGRRALLRNAINRQIVWSVVVWSVAALAGRVLSALVGMPVAHALLFEMLILAAGAAGAAVALVPWIGWIAAIFGGGLVVGAWKPGWAPELVMGSTSLALLTAMGVWRLQARRGEREETPGGTV